MHMNFRGSAGVALLVMSVIGCLSSGAFAQSGTAADSSAPSVEFTRDIVYGKGGDQDLKLDMARPKGSEQAMPCVVVIHGGGWAAGDKRDHDDAIQKLATHGYVAVTVGYRLAPAHPFPAQVQDVKCAVRFLRANAGKYNIDPDHIGAVGFSAGAHLSMMLGATTAADGLEGDGGWPDASSAVQAVVSFFGPTELGADDFPEVTRPILAKFLGGDAGAAAVKPGAYAKASPITYLHKGCPPMLLFQGTADPLVPPTQAYRMADAMTRAGVPGRVEILVGAGHGFGGADMLHTLQQTVLFFNDHLDVQRGGSKK